MGVWGAGNLESDGTLDVVSERSGVLLGRLWSALQEQESWEADESLHDELFVDIEWAIALHSAGLLSVWDLVPPEQFDAAVSTWLAGWSDYFDGLSGPEFKAERRASIEKSFASLRGLFSTAQQQRGGPLQAGDVLSIPATGGALFARVLQVLGPDCGLPADGPLMALAPALLLELWAQAPSETRFPKECPVLVPGLLCDLDALEAETWKVVGHKPVLLGELDYPMCISNETGGPTLCWGEICAPLDLPPGAVQAIGVFPTVLSSDTMAQRALLAMDLEELVAEQDRAGLAMDKVDLRFSEDRGALMEMAGLDVEKRYGEALAAWKAQQA